MYYFLEPDQWGIDSTGQNAEATTKGFNDALKYAHSQSLTTVIIPKGDYLIDGVNLTQSRPEYYGGIIFHSNSKIVIHPEAVFKVKPNSSWGYSCFYIGKEVKNITITGGTIIGDRYEHDYSVQVKNRESHEWGYGIHVRGAQDVIIENVTVQDCTGDNIWVSYDGMMNYEGQVYTPSKNVLVSNVKLYRGRRNNIATDGCLGLIVENSLIADSDGDIDPRLGMDIEGFAENSIKYNHPYEVIVRNNTFRGNTGGCISAEASGKVIMNGNFFDGRACYGYGTDVVISNNVFSDLTQTKTAINSHRVSSTEKSNNVVISNNVIKGYSNGIDARGKNVVIEGNSIAEVKTKAIYVYLAENVTVSNNNIFDSPTCLPIKLQLANNIKVTGNYASKIDDIAFHIVDSENINVSDNKLDDVKTGFYIERSKGSIVMNYIDLKRRTGSQGINYDKSCVLMIKDNEIKSPANYGIFGISNEGVSNMIVDNIITDVQGTSAMNIYYGKNHIIQGNIIVYNKSTSGGTGVYLIGCNGAKIMRNHVESISGNSIFNAYRSFDSTNTKIIFNTYNSGTIYKNDTDTELNNVKI
ncbi:right-handed parallel beta-helix repeat-containing protein [Bacillus subtilis]|uniref:right-handed parallel beta-helix repeat-containing protein n=1 Tax=Bacillus subtilis TaxID=1423 RepID=UPI002ED16E38